MEARTQKTQNDTSDSFESFEAIESEGNKKTTFNLKSDVVDIARVRLIRASEGLDVGIDELMGWYEKDYQRIKKMRLDELKVYVNDYCNQRDVLQRSH